MNLRLCATILLLFTGSIGPCGIARSEQVLRFVSLDPSQRQAVTGKLSLPEHAAAKSPAVVIVHSTGGVDGTGAAYAEKLNQAGVATFEVDFKTGVFSSSLDRPEPETFQPLGFAALKLLRANAAIDPDKIGLLGFSLGAIVAIDSLADASAKRWLGADKSFAAYAALYPDCRHLIRTLNDVSLQQAPILVLYGALDAYGAAEFCPALESDLKGRVRPAPTFVIYPDAHHGFDRPGVPLTYDDPWATNGRGHIEFNERAAQDARSKVVAFFERWLTESARLPP